jgi:hypothetical protein
VSTNGHPYQACRDTDCEKYACRVYKEAYRDGYEDGYAAGFTDGIASCPRNHSG